MARRHIRLTPAAVHAQREKEHAKVCVIPKCGRPVAVEDSEGHLLRSKRYCSRHLKQKSRPLDFHTAPISDPIPDSVRTHICQVPDCERMADVERAVKLIDNRPVPGWLVRSYCRHHKSPLSRPVGWVPLQPEDDGRSPERLERIWHLRIKGFLGIHRWADRGIYTGTIYRLTVNRTLHLVNPHALNALREEIEKPWKDRQTLGAFASVYNLAVVAVVGATLAIYESQE